MPADSPEYVERTIKEAFGSDLDAIFESFDLEPMASASVAQVHRGVIRAGMCPVARPGGESTFLESELEVAVKVQHEGIEPMMRSDIVAFRRIMLFIAYLNPNFAVAVQLLDAWETEMLKELDFSVEALNLVKVRSNLREAGLLQDDDHDYADLTCRGTQVLVPKPIHAFVNKRAFCMTFVHGFKITDTEQLDLFAVDRCALVKRVVQAYSNQLYVDGFFNADPHAGNLMVSISDDGTARPVLLDFGMVVTLPPEQRGGYCELVHSISNLSVSGLTEAIVRVGYKNSQSDEHPERDLEFFSFLLRDTGSRKQQKASSAQFRSRRKKQRKDDLAIDPSKQGRTMANIPDSLIFLFRVLGLIRGLCTTLDAPISYVEIMGDYARLGLVKENLKTEQREGGIAAKLPVPRKIKLSAKATALNSKVVAILNSYAQSAAELSSSEGFGMTDFCGAQICCLSKGEVLVNEAVGAADELGPEHVTSDTLFPMMDLTRLLPILAVLKLRDQGKLAFEDKVVQHWPSYGDATVTIGEVLSHATRVRDSISATSSVNVLAKTEDMFLKVAAAKAVASEKAEHGRSKYQVFTQGFILGGLLCSIFDGQSLESIIASEVVDPASMNLEVFLSARDCLPRRLAKLSNGFAGVARGFLLGGSQIPPALLAMGGSVDTSAPGNDEKAGDEGVPQESDPLGGIRLPSGALLDPCCPNSRPIRSATVPSFGGFSTAHGLAKVLHHALFKTASKGLLKQLATSKLSGESSPLFGDWRWSYGFQLYSLDSSSKLDVLCHHAFGGSLVLVVPDKQVVLVVMVNCLTLDRSLTKEVATTVLTELGIASPSPLFGGMF